MVDVTVSGKIVEVKKVNGECSGPSVKIVVEDRNGSRSDIWIFAEDLSAFNEIKEPE
jgi:hypothetical protein